jgi:hypothetical protein
MPHDNDDGTLFDPANAARTSDPPTSHAAARQLDPSKVEASCNRYLRVIAAAKERGATRDDVADAVDARGAEDRALSRRLTDLHQAGLIEASGRTRPSHSQREQIVWVLTGPGRMHHARVLAAEAGGLL